MPGKITHLALAAGLGFAIPAGCTTQPPSHLIFHQQMVVGADISANPDSGTADIIFGYDRQTTTILPKSRVDAGTIAGDPCANPGKKPEECHPDGMSILSQSIVKIGIFGTDNVHERFATGEPARTLSQSPEGITVFSNTFTGQSQGSQ